jgi:hypothetical protein
MPWARWDRCYMHLYSSHDFYLVMTFCLEELGQDLQDGQGASGKGLMVGSVRQSLVK